MRRSLVRVSTVALLLTAVAALPAPAQRVLGIGDDALVLPRGVLRVRTLGQWTTFNERYGLNTPGRADGRSITHRRCGGGPRSSAQRRQSPREHAGGRAGGRGVRSGRTR